MVSRILKQLLHPHAVTQPKFRLARDVGRRARAVVTISVLRTVALFHASKLTLVDVKLSLDLRLLVHQHHCRLLARKILVPIVILSWRHMILLLVPELRYMLLLIVVELGRRRIPGIVDLLLLELIQITLPEREKFSLILVESGFESVVYSTCIQFAKCTYVNFDFMALSSLFIKFIYLGIIWTTINGEIYCGVPPP